ncbi:MAG: hypothetical protein ABI723_21240 [Bacteroidia bacterium]
MRSLLLTIVIIFSISFNLVAQVPPEVPTGDPPPAPKKSFGERLVFGGFLGAQFGTNTQVNISPIIGYRVTEKLTAGVGITYIYYKYEYYTGYNQTYTEEDHIFGSSLWGEYRVIPQAFIHVEPGLLNLSVPKLDPYGYYHGDTYRKNIYTFLVGGGYYQAIGSNAGMQFSILWDLVEDMYSPYQNPIIRIGFAAGF